MGRYFGFILAELPVVPRIGENMTIPFARAALGFDAFYVKNILYKIEGAKQIVDITLKAGDSNTYLKLRKDKAQALGELSHHEAWEINNYKMERKIRKGELRP